MPAAASSNSAIASGSRLPWPQSSTAGLAHPPRSPPVDSPAAAADTRGRDDPAGRCRPAAAAARRPRARRAVRRHAGGLPPSSRIRSSSPAARSPSSTASSTARPAASGARRERGIVTVVVLVGAAAALGWRAASVLCRGSLIGAVVEALLIGVLLAQRSLFEHVAAVAAALADGRAAGRARGGAAYRRPRPDEPRRARRRARRDREPGREFQRRRRRAGLLVPAARPARPLRLQDGEHARQHDRPSHAALPRLRLGGGAPRRCARTWCRRGSAALLLAAAAVFAGDARPGRRCAIMLRDARKHHSPNAGWPESGDGRGARSGAGRAAPLRRRVSSPIRGSATAAPRAGVADIARALQLYRARLPARRRAVAGRLARGACSRCSPEARRPRRGQAAPTRSRLCFEMIGERVEGASRSSCSYAISPGSAPSRARKARRKGSLANSPCR